VGLFGGVLDRPMVVRVTNGEGRGVGGDTVVWEYAAWLEPGCAARIVSITAPDGMVFDSGIHPGDRFQFVPHGAGRWDFRDAISGGVGRLTAGPVDAAGTQ
jgi:hypothetical protein